MPWLPLVLCYRYATNAALLIETAIFPKIDLILTVIKPISMKFEKLAISTPSLDESVDVGFRNFDLGRVRHDLRIRDGSTMIHWMICYEKILMKS